eukprot:CFRG0845T1
MFKSSSSSWDYSDYRKLSSLAFVASLIFVLVVILGAFIVTAIAVTTPWASSEDIVLYLGLGATLVCVFTVISIMAVIWRHQNRPMIRSRGQTYLVFMLIGALCSMILAYLTVLAMYGVIKTTTNVVFCLALFQKIAQNIFITSVIARQRLIYLIFLGNAQHSRLKRAFETGLAVLQIPFLIAQVPYGMWFFDRSYPMVMMYVGDCIVVFFYTVVFLYYVYGSYGAGPRFSDFYQNLRISVISPLIYYTSITLMVVFMAEPWSVFIIQYCAQTIDMMFILDSFVAVIYVVLIDVDSQIFNVIPATTVGKSFKDENTSKPLKSTKGAGSDIHITDQNVMPVPDTASNLDDSAEMTPKMFSSSNDGDELNMQGENVASSMCENEKKSMITENGSENGLLV